MFAHNTSDELRRSIYEGMMSVPHQVVIGAMRGMTTDVSLFDLIAGLEIPNSLLMPRVKP